MTGSQKSQPPPVCVVGKTVPIRVEADEHFAPDVEVTFEGFYRDDQDEVHLLKNWTQSLRAEPAGDTPGGRRATHVPWAVHLNGDAEASRHTTTLLATVRGRGAASGRRRTARCREPMVVQGFRITTDPRLTRIMRHEFSKPEGSEYVFDPAQVQSVLDGLSPQQRELLAGYEVKKPEGRLVCFFTLTPRNDLLFGSDYCLDGVHMAKPNASFSVFHCLGPGKDVTLVCHTRYALINRRNPSTAALVTSARNGKPVNEWLSRSNPKPVLFKVATIRPQGTTDGCIFHRVFDKNGVDVMPANTIHGMVNTKGCWMLFRNYNWPLERFIDFTRIYCQHREGLRYMSTYQRTPGETRARLVAAGYDVETESDGNSSSYDKFFLYDRNFAYLWFLHDVVGIRYFSNQWRFGGRLHPDPGRRVNDWKPTGKEFHKTFPLKELEKDPEYNAPEEGAYAYYDDMHRLGEDRSARNADPSANIPMFKADARLWGTNALGFRTAEDFIPHPFGKEVPVLNLSPPELDRYSWADLYLYREDAVDMTTTPRLYEEPI